MWETCSVSGFFSLKSLNHPPYTSLREEGLWMNFLFWAKESMQIEAYSIKITSICFNFKYLDFLLFYALD